MIKFKYFVRLALTNLVRSGQRVLVALLCIVFGVMALVAMTMLSKSIENTLVLEPAEELGGDLSIGRMVEDTLRPEDIQQLADLQAAGKIDAYTLIAYNSSVMFHTPGSGEMHFANNGMGVEPDTYPLVGSLTIGQPGSVGLPTLLQQAGDVIVTRDIAQEFDLHVGDPIILADLNVGVPVQGVVRAIAYDTPNHQGSKIYYTAETAQILSGGLDVVNVAIVTSSDPDAVGVELTNSGWSVTSATFLANGNQQVTDMIVLFLRGAGILGLLVGGIGIANTMQVLLRRRQREIAIWKTLGYTGSDLRFIFSLEAGLLGMFGSLIGAGLGVLISTQLLELFRRTSTLLYGWTFSLTPPLMGVLVGTLTTVIFAYWAIVVSSQAKPMALLRNEPIEVDRLSRWKSLGLGLLLAAPFTVVTSLVMESFIKGIGVLLFALVSVAVLGLIFSLILRVFTRLLAIRRFPLLSMSVKNLRRRGPALIFAMIALFAGIVTMSLGVMVVQTSQREIGEHAINLQGYNLNILALPDQEDAIRQAVEAQNPEQVGLGYRTTLQSLQVVDVSEPDGFLLQPELVGRSSPDEYDIRGADWGTQPGVYVDRGTGLEIGSQIEVTFRDGTTQVFPVIGTYVIDYERVALYPVAGLLMPIESFTQYVQPDALTYFVSVAPDQVSETAAALGEALPQATVVNLMAYLMRYVQVYQNLFVLAMAMAGLALLAGVLLIANSVSLAMLDRRYEIGILKAVGYSQRQVLTIFAVEYGLIGVLATAAGLTVVQVFLWFLAVANQLAASLLQLDLQGVFIIAACGIGLTLLTIAGVTWKPTRISPVTILAERN